MSQKLLTFLFLLSFFSAMPQEKTNFKSVYQKAASFLYKNRDSTYFYFNKALRLADEQDNMTYVMASHNYLLKANAIYYDLERYRENLKEIAIMFACDPRLENNPYKEHYHDFYLFYKGGYYYKIAQYEKAEKCFLQYYKKLKKIPSQALTKGNLKSIYAAQSWLGNIYVVNHKYNLAKKYYNKSIDLIRRHQKDAFDESAIALNNLYLARVLEKEGKYKKAEGLIKKSLVFYLSVQENTRFKNSISSSYRLLIANYLKQKQPDKALSSLQEMRESKFVNPQNLNYFARYLQLKARAFMQKKDFETALQFYQKALKTTQDYYHTKFHPEIAKLYKEIGGLYAEQHQFERSLSTFQKSFSALSKDFESASFSDNPKPKKVLSKLALIEILGKKQKVLAQAFQNENKLEYLQAANQTAKSLVRTLDALKPEFESKVDMQFLLGETYPAFYQMMETAFLLHQKTGEKTYLEDAFYYSEKSKAVWLLSAVQKTGATKFAGIPDSVLTQEQQYRATINHLEKKRFKNPNEEQLSDQLFDLKNEFYAFLGKIEKKYPNYHQLKLKTKVANLQTIQNLLQPEEAFLDYYLTDDFLYYFVITKEKTRFERVPFKKKASKRILQLKEYFSKPQITKIEALKTLGDEVYRQVVPKLDNTLSSLIISRSGILNYLPFGALYNLEKQTYLIEAYAISYANSATLYQEYTQQKKEKDPELLAFAPSFSGDNLPKEIRSGLAPLLHNKEEAKFVSDYFKGAVLLGENASLKAFKKQAKNYGILHLATHAVINDKFPDYSFLAFASKDSLANLLYIQDLYNYHLNADLVVLSACETGIGKLQKGAGMLSLARGFNYAGANALVTTQWKIDDGSASLLMKNFYKNLAEGQAKNVALRNAKLHYLKTTDDAMLRQPYYWAGFVLSGNVSPVVSSSSWIFITSVIALLFLLIFLIFRKRKRSS